MLSGSKPSHWPTRHWETAIYLEPMNDLNLHDIAPLQALKLSYDQL